MAKTPAKRTPKPAAPSPVVLPADLAAMDEAVSAVDKTIADALIRGAEQRSGMLNEIAMLRRQVETLTKTNGVLVAGIETVRTGWASGKADLSPLFEVAATAREENKALDEKRQDFYAPRETARRDRELVDTVAKAVASPEEDGLPPFLLGEAPHPLDKPHTETVIGRTKVIGQIAATMIVGFVLTAMSWVA